MRSSWWLVSPERCSRWPAIAWYWSTQSWSYVGIGKSGTGFTNDASLTIPANTSNSYAAAYLNDYPSAGYTAYTWKEKNSGLGTSFFTGDNGESQGVQSGLLGWIEG